jgi:hypothetical protein
MYARKVESQKDPSDIRRRQNSKRRFLLFDIQYNVYIHLLKPGNKIAKTKI